jgi:hypothetical protein
MESRTGKSRSRRIERTRGSRLSAIYTEIGNNPRINLTSLPMPAEFRKLFQDWKAGRVNFLKFAKQYAKQGPAVDD